MKTVTGFVACVYHGTGPMNTEWTRTVPGFRGHLERSVASSGLGDHLLLPGRVSDTKLHAWYEAATLFIHPTLYEGSSIVTLEAMSHHLPVVATRAGGLPDKVRPGVNGWLVEPGDTEALTTAVAQALAQRDRLAAMGAESRASRNSSRPGTSSSPIWHGRRRPRRLAGAPTRPSASCNAAPRKGAHGAAATAAIRAGATPVRGSATSAANSASVQKADKSTPAPWRSRRLASSHARSNSATRLSATARACARASVARSRSRRWTAMSAVPSLSTTRKPTPCACASATVFEPATTVPCRSGGEYDARARFRVRVIWSRQNGNLS